MDVGPGTRPGLGYAEFKLAIDDDSFKKKLIEAEQQAEHTSKRIGQAFGRGGGAAQGLLALGQAVDDAQYGFRAIVNNIPQVVTMFGGSMGLAGAIGIAAVAINQLINHWDELKATMDQSAPVTELTKKIEGLGTALTEVSTIAAGEAFPGIAAAFTKIEKASTALGFGPGARQMGRQVAAEEAAGKAAQEHLEKSPILSKEAEERLKMFKEAIKEYGGSDKLQQELTDRLQRSMPNVEATKVAGFAARMIQENLQGGKIDPSRFGHEFEKAYEEVTNKAFQKQEKHDLKIVHDRETAELNKQGQELEAQTKLEHDKEIHELERQKDLLHKQRQNILETVHEMKQPKHFQGAKAFADSIMMAGIGTPQKEMLKEAKELNKKIDKLTDEVKKANDKFRGFAP